MLFFEILWWMQAFRHDYFSYFPSRYLLSITMIFGATVAGMTSEGGGAVAFPVMTLALGMVLSKSEVLVRPALLCHKDTANGKKCPLSCVFMA